MGALADTLKARKSVYWEGGISVEYVGLLAPIAFVFAISAYTQLSALRKEVESLKAEIAKLKVK